MRGWLRGLLALLLATGIAPAPAQEIPESQRILECLLDTLPERARIRDLVVRTRGEANDTVPERLRLDLAVRYREGRIAARLLVREPEDLRGTAYLYRQEGGGEMAIYYHAPEVGRTRRVTGGDRGTLLDTALSFSDITEGMRALRSASISLRPKRDELPEAQREFLILPPPESELPFSRISLRVDSERCIAIAAEAQNDQREPLRRLAVETDSLREREGGYWVPERLRIDNPEIGRSSELRVGDFRADVALPERLFDPERFHRSD